MGVEVSGDVFGIAGRTLIGECSSYCECGGICGIVVGTGCKMV